MQDVSLITPRSAVADALARAFAALDAAYRLRRVAAWPSSPPAIVVWDVGGEEWREQEVEGRLWDGRGQTAVLLIVTPEQEERARTLAEAGLCEYLCAERIHPANLGRALRALRRLPAEVQTAGDRMACETFTQALLNATPGVITVLDLAQDGVVYANQTAETILGRRITQDESISSLMAQLAHPDDVSALQSYMAQFRDMGEGEVTDIVVRIRATDGRYRWLRTRHAALSRFSDGRVREIVALAQDITEEQEALQALRRSQARTRAVLDAIPDLMFRLTPEGEVIDYTASDPQDLAVPLDEIIGSRVADVFPPGSSKMILQHVSRALRTGTPQVFEYSLPLSHGSQTFEARLVVSGPDEVLAIVRNVTERKEAEQALQRSEARFRKIVENAQPVIFMIDVNGIFTLSEGEQLAALGLEPGEAVGQSALQIYRSYPAVVEAIKATWRGEEVRHPDLAVEGVDGSPVYFDVFYSPYEDADGNILGTIGMAVDITQYKLAEAAEREQRQLAMALVKTAEAVNEVLSFDGVLDRILTAIGNLVPHDGANLMLLDRERETLRVVQYCDCYVKSGLHIPTLNTPVPLARLPHLQRIIEGEEPLRIRDTRTHDDWRESDTTKPVRSYLSVPIKVEDEIIGLINLDSAAPGFFQKKHEKWLQMFAHQAAIAIRNAQLHESVQEQLVRLRQAQSRLVQSEKLAAIGELVAGVAHELNNPLAALVLHAQLLQKTLPNKGADRSLNTIVTQAHRASSIVRNLLDFARQRPSERVRMQINDVVDSTLDLMAYELRTHNVAVALDLDPDLPPVLADASQIQQVLVNLIQNAMQAMEDEKEGWLRVTTGVAPSHFMGGEGGEPVAQIMVQDNGPGISAAIQSRLFDPFFTTKEIGEGTGLGLSVCHGIIREHGGDIWVESEKGQGATFWIELPLLAGEATSDSLTETAVMPRQGEKGRILVVDDEESILAVIGRVLGGFQVDQVQRGKTAVTYVADHEYDLIICDVHMPGMSGVDFYRHLEKTHPHLVDRVLFITGDVLNAHAKAFLQQVKAPVLAKPFEIDELQTAVSQLLQTPSSSEKKEA